MFGFFKKFKKQTDIVQETEANPICDNGMKEIGVGYATTQVVQSATMQAAIKYKKPNTYTENRILYDNGTAKANAKRVLFSDQQKIVDPYTEKDLVLTIKEAKQKYGSDWANHLAESDHIKPLEKIYDDTQNSVWNTVDDIKKVANCDDNIRVVSRKYNNAKRSRTNKEFVEDEEYLKAKGINLTKEGKQRAIHDGEIAEKSIKRQLKKASFNNALQTGHEAGKIGAQYAGITSLTMSGIMNFVSIIKGEKSANEAVEETIKDGGKAALSGYVMSNGLTVISHTLSNSSSQFIRGLVSSNVPGKVITAINVMGKTLESWASGEITTQQCLIQLGDKGLNLATMSYTMAVGQALIPIPVIGGAIGALVGSVLTSTYYRELVETLQVRELEHQERIRLIAESYAAAEQSKRFRNELEKYLDSYFQEYKDCFDSALSAMRLSYQSGDADGIIASANEITRKIGGAVYYEDVEGFKDFLDSHTVDVL